MMASAIKREVGSGWFVTGLKRGPNVERIYLNSNGRENAGAAGTGKSNHVAKPDEGRDRSEAGAGLARS
ncbi:hypothetical protein PSP6_270061 [Paraburkholderia tropica]|nr:hypothetical protein PSP6_270061 [Paraburkholderia tropica]